MVEVETLIVGAGGLIAEKRNLPIGITTLAVASAFLIIPREQAAAAFHQLGAFVGRGLLRHAGPGFLGAAHGALDLDGDGLVHAQAPAKRIE